MHIQDLLQKAIQNDSFIWAVLSSPRKKTGSYKTTFTPILIQKKEFIQVSEQVEKQVLHENIIPPALPDYFLQKLSQYKQGCLYTEEHDYYITISKTEEIAISKKPPTRSKALQSHNRTKQYLLQEGTPTPFLIHLDIMSHEGKVYPKKYDKFRQLNRFLEFIRDIIPNLPTDQTIRVIDFGCGKSYLTFALYHYLHNVLGHEVNILGLDLKKDVIDYCEKLARTLEFTGLHFAVGNIENQKETEEIDLVVSLHACDTATDAALSKSIEWNAKVILCVPCCQHELFKQVENSSLKPMLKYGIIKERFASLATDAARAQLLEIAGYKTQILEFIDMEHTPKNLLIRAVRKKGETNSKLIEEYKLFKRELLITPYLERYIKGI